MRYPLTPATALAAFQSLGTKLQPGDVLELGAGLYTQPLVLPCSGQPEAPLRIETLGAVQFTTPTAANLRTNGHSYWQLGGWISGGSASAVTVEGVSAGVGISHISALKNKHAIRIDAGTDIRVEHCLSESCKKGFHAITGRHLTFQDCEAYRSFDDYEGPSPEYRNGDGFLFEAAVTDVLLRRIRAEENADAGLDCKASRVRILESIFKYNKNNVKLWGQTIALENCLMAVARRQAKPSGGFVEGNGMTCEINPNTGLSAIVTAEQCTFVDNEHFAVQLLTNAALTLKSCILVASPTASGLFDRRDGQVLLSTESIWWQAGRPQPVYVLHGDQYGDPQFVDRVNYLTSPLITAGFQGITPPIDAQAKSPAPTPSPLPTPTPPPVPVPVPAPVPLPSPVPGPVPVPPGAITAVLALEGKSSSTLKYADKKQHWKLEVPTALLPSKPAQVRVSVSLA